MMQSLSDYPTRATVRVCALEGEPHLRERLAELGFTPGAVVSVLRRAPLGDPVHVMVRGGSFALRAAEASAVLVEPVEQPPRRSP